MKNLSIQTSIDEAKYFEYMNNEKTIRAFALFNTFFYQKTQTEYRECTAFRHLKTIYLKVVQNNEQFTTLDGLKENTEIFFETALCKNPGSAIDLNQSLRHYRSTTSNRVYSTPLIITMLTRFLSSL